MKNPIIEVNNLSKKYALGERQSYYSFRDTISSIFHTPFRREKLKKDEFWALKNLSFNIFEGEVVGIIGRNGAGKSTLLKILSQITPPTEGEVKLRGRVASLLEVGTGFHPELTGRENIYLNGAILGMKRREINKRFEEIVEFSEIEKFLDTPVKHYSSGMYMRLAFSVAAHLESEILLVDEVLSVGDAQFQKKCLGKMDEISKKQGRTVIYVSHNLDTLLNLCDTAILLDYGKIIEQGKTKDVVARYLDDSVYKKADIFKNRNNLYTNNLIVEDFRMYSKTNDEVSSINMGDSSTFKVQLSKKYFKPNYLVGIIFKSTGGQILTSTNTGMNLVGSKISDCAYLEVEEVPFTPGRYVVDISITDNKYARVDYVSNAFVFEIRESDYYKSGYMVQGGNGVIYLKGKWFYK